jgi:hypothetical protein
MEAQEVAAKSKDYMIVKQAFIPILKRRIELEIVQLKTTMKEGIYLQKEVLQFAEIEIL